MEIRLLLRVARQNKHNETRLVLEQTDEDEAFQTNENGKLCGSMSPRRASPGLCAVPRSGLSGLF